jgi:hypothetical protein
MLDKIFNNVIGFRWIREIGGTLINSSSHGDAFEEL